MRARAVPIVAAFTLIAALPLAAPAAAQSPAPSPEPGGVVLTLLHNNDGGSLLLPLPYQVDDAGTRLAVGGIPAFASVLGREIADAHTNGHSVLTVHAGESSLRDRPSPAACRPRPTAHPSTTRSPRRRCPTTSTSSATTSSTSGRASCSAS